MKDHLLLAIRAAIEAGIEIMKIYDTDFEILSKDDDSPLTTADKNANAIINTYLKQTDIPIISEENKQLDYAERKDWEQCWIVDPLDGTKEFIKRNGEFTVNIALAKNGIPIMGVIYVPVLQTLYFGSQTLGTSKKIENISDSSAIETLMDNAEILTPNPTAEVIKIVGSRSHLNPDTEAYIEEVAKDTSKEIEIVSKGSSLKFCLVAEGDAQIYPRFAPTMEWDTAAGDAICRMVGVQVIDQKTQKPMIYNKANLLNNYFLVIS